MQYPYLCQRLVFTSYCTPPSSRLRRSGHTNPAVAPPKEWSWFLRTNGMKVLPKSTNRTTVSPMSAKLAKWLPDEHMRTRGLLRCLGGLYTGVVQQIPIVMSISGTHHLAIINTFHYKLTIYNQLKYLYESWLQKISQVVVKKCPKVWGNKVQTSKVYNQ